MTPATFKLSLSTSLSNLIRRFRRNQRIVLLPPAFPVASNPAHVSPASPAVSGFLAVLTEIIASSLDSHIITGEETRRP